MLLVPFIRMMIHQVRYHLIHYTNLKTSSSCNLNGNVITQGSHLLEKCNRPIPPRSFKSGSMSVVNANAQEGILCHKR